jgi:hypothetical protein
VKAIGAATIPKLSQLGCNALAAIPRGLSECDLVDRELMQAWERACLSELTQGDANGPTREHRDANGLDPVPLSAPTALVQMAPRHLSEIAVGLGGLGWMPGDEWTEAYFGQVGGEMMKHVLAHYNNTHFAPTPAVPLGFCSLWSNFILACVCQCVRVAVR